MTKTKILLSPEDGLFWGVESGYLTRSSIAAVFSHALMHGFMTYEHYKSGDMTDRECDRVWDCWRNIEPSVRPVIASNEKLVDISECKFINLNNRRKDKTRSIRIMFNRKMVLDTFKNHIDFKSVVEKEDSIQVKIKFSPHFYNVPDVVVTMWDDKDYVSFDSYRDNELVFSRTLPKEEILNYGLNSAIRQSFYVWDDDD